MVQHSYHGVWTMDTQANPMDEQALEMNTPCIVGRVYGFTFAYSSLSMLGYPT